MAVVTRIRKKVLLLNPPGEKMYLRDYYCSTVSKAGYYWHPIDLLVQSGFLSQEYEIGFIDAIVEQISWNKCLQTAVGFKPDVIVFLSGTQSWKNDFDFVHILKKATGAKLIGSGEIFFENGQEIIASHPFLDGAMLEFINQDLRHYLRGDYDSIDKMIYRINGDVRVKESTNRAKEFEIPTPRHDLFLSKKYKLPFVRHPFFATIMTNYGCLFYCSFCNSGSLGFKTRKIENIMTELEYLRALGCGHVFVKDMSFAANREHALQFCQALSGSRLKFDWNCYSRPDLIDEELALTMKSSGCLLIQFGIESGDEKVSKSSGKDIDLGQIHQAFLTCRKHNILTGAHLILGLPGESMASQKKTHDLLKELKPDYISLNIFAPRKGSKFSNYPKANSKKLLKIRNKYYRHFYLRPRYLFGNMMKTQNISKLFESVAMGFNLLKNSVISSRKP